VAFVVAWGLTDGGRRILRLINFGFLALVCLLVVVLGVPSG